MVHTNRKTIDIDMSLSQIKTITVYGASSPNIDESYISAAKDLGSILAHSGIRIVTGAGSTGLMAAIEDGVLESGGEAIGIIPTFMVREGWMHKSLSQVIETEDMHKRKELMAQMADAVVALPGGPGTFEELMEIITWKMLGLFSKPIVILNTNGYYNPLLKMLQTSADSGFMREEFLSAWIVVENPENVLPAIVSNIDWNPGVDKYQKC